MQKFSDLKLSLTIEVGSSNGVEIFFLQLYDCINIIPGTCANVVIIPIQLLIENVIKILLAIHNGQGFL